MFYEDQETDIVTKLQPTDATVYEAVPYPETEAEHKVPYMKPRISVALHASKYGEELTTDNTVAQDQTLSWLLILESKRLRGTGGIYHLAEICQKRLLGFQPKWCQRMKGVQLTFVQRDEKTQVIEYSLVMSCVLQAMSDSSEEILADNINSITVMDDCTEVNFVLTNALQTETTDELITQETDQTISS